MYALMRREEIEKQSKYFLNKLKGALMYKGGTGELSEQFERIVTSCFKNGIILDCSLVSDKIMEEMNKVQHIAQKVIEE